MNIRKANISDIDTIVKLYNSLIGTLGCTWSLDYPNIDDVKKDIDNDSLYVLEEENKIIGAACASYDDELKDLKCFNKQIKRPCELARIGIKEKYQGRGLAKVLLKYIEDDCIKRGFDGIRFIVSKTNPKALSLYNKMGFNNVGETVMYDIEWFCYEKKLEKNVYPKVEFVPISLEKNIDIVKWAYFESDKSLDVYQYTIDYFKELKTIDDTWSKEKIYCFIEEIVTKHYNQNIKFINEEVNRYNKIWNEFNDEYFKVLTNYLNINFPPSLKVINGFVGLLPICPRYLDTFDFCLSIGTNEDDIKRICAHETLHFLWYFKWLELYPDTKLRELDSPYIPWKYSEMVVDPIINSKEIQTVIDELERAYDSFYDIKDKNNKYMMDILNSIYLENISIEEKIKKGFEYIKKTLIFDEYLNQDINNPKYLFHGSSKKLDIITTHLSSDSSNNQNNIADAVFLFPSFLKATPYAFKDNIKENSDGLNWNFKIPNNNDYPLMIMSNVSIDKNIMGYVYVFKKDDDMIKDESSYQYKCYKDIVPVDVILISYDDYKEFYKVEV